MEITGRQLLKDWNDRKGTSYTIGSEENPSGRSRTLQRCVATEGDCFIDWFGSKLNDETFTYDVENVCYLGWDYREFKKQWELDQKKAGDADVGTLTILSKELIKLIGKDLATEVEGTIQQKLDAYVQDKTFVKIVQIGDIETKKLDEVTHEQFENILKFVAMDEPVMLVGPAGSGKNVIASQVAKALGLDFYFSNAITQEYQLTGFVDAMGNYQGTQFYEAFTKGGVFLLDEIDASVPEVLIKINAAIANRYFDFPKYGRVQAHKNFRVIACANTWGNGASMEYVGRNQLDGASVNRFASVFIDYDPRIEEFISENDKDVLDFCRNVRRLASENGNHLIVSYREINRLHKMIVHAKMNIVDAIQTCVLKGLEKDSVRLIFNGMPTNVTYRTQLGELIEKM